MVAGKDAHQYHRARRRISENTAGAGLVQDSVVNYSMSTWIMKMDMNRAISVTNVVLILAISPSLWLAPCAMIIFNILKAAYNNKVKTAISGMRFGVNDGLNHHKSSVVPKVAHQPAASHLDNLDKPYDKPSKQVAEKIPSKVLQPVKMDHVVVSNIDSHTTVLELLRVMRFGTGYCPHQICVVIYINRYRY